MTVQAVTRTAGWEAPVRERDWRSGAGSDFALYLAGLLHRPGLTQFAGRQELSGQDEGWQETAGKEVDAVRPGGAGRGKAATMPEDRAGHKVRETGPEGAGEDRTPSGVKSRQGENQSVALKQEEAPAGQQGAKKAAGDPVASGDPDAAAGKASAATARAGNSHRSNMPAGNGAPAGEVNLLSKEGPGILFPGRKAAGSEAVTGKFAASAATAAQGKKVAALAAGEGAAVLAAAGTSGVAGEEASLAPEGVLMARGDGAPDYGSKIEAARGSKVPGSREGFPQPQGITEGQGQVKGGGESFARAAGDWAGAPGVQDAFNPANRDPGRSPAGGQRGTGTAGGPGIAGNDSIGAGQGSFPALFPGNGQQAGGVVLPVSNLPGVLATIMASARMSRSGSQQELEIQLQPESLGNMKLKATLEGGRLVLHLLVENSEAARALQAAVPEMRQAVAQQGLRLDQVQVQVGGEGPGSGSQAGDSGEQSRGSPGWYRGMPGWAGHEEKETVSASWYRLDYLA